MEQKKFGKKYKIAVIGGGFSGLICAIKLNEIFNGQVTLLERNDRLCKKVASTGNGRGNISNKIVNESFYHGDVALVKTCLKRYSNDSLIDFFKDCGLLTVEENGRIYPSSMQASSVCDVLRLKAQYENLDVKLQYFVTEIKREKSGYMINNEIFCEKIVVCVGGKSMKNFGTDGNLIPILKGLGEEFTELYPSLVQLKTQTDKIKGLKGIKQQANASLYDGNKLLKTFSGDVLFTDYGVSGDCIFRLSSYLENAKNPVLKLEFIPEISFQDLKNFLIEKSKLNYCKNQDLLTGVVNNRLGLTMLKNAKLNALDHANEKSCLALLSQVKDFKLAVQGTLGFDYSQVTHGGVKTENVEQTDLQSKINKNLYYCGEILNVDGDCGGYNLQWAYTSARIVAEELIKQG